MANLLEKKKWELHEKKYKLLLEYGAKKGLIKVYDEKLIADLRQVYYKGLPVSILILHKWLSNGHCFDRALLISLGFNDDDFQVITANVDSLRLNPYYIDEYQKNKISNDYATHRFAQRIKKDGTTWIYDTSIGLIFDKELYSKIENPRIKYVFDKQTTLECLDDFQKESNIEEDKYALPLILPNLERYLVPIQPFYYELLKQEIALFKKTIHYEKICKEISEDFTRKMF